MFRSLIIFTLLGLYHQCLARGVYQPSVQTSIEELWRWTELEALSGMDYFIADEGNDGDIWFAGPSEVARYDGREVEVFNVGEHPVVDLLVSVSGEVYVLTERNLFVYREDSWVNLSAGQFNSTTFRLMCESQDGDIWIAGWASVSRFSGGEWERFRLGNFWVSSMLVDDKGMLWLVPGDHDEIFVYDTIKPNGREFELIHRFEVPSPNRVARLFLDDLGRIWNAVPDEEGKCYYFENYQQHVGAEGFYGPFKDALINRWALSFDVAIMPSGSKWYAAPRGLAEVKNGVVTQFRKKNLLPWKRPIVLGMSNEHLLIGGVDARTYLVDLSLDRWATYKKLNYQCTDKKGRSWYLEHGGKCVSNLVGDQDWYSYDSSDGVIDSPNSIYCSSDGTVWASGSHEGVAAIAYLENEEWNRVSFPLLGSIFSHLGVVESEEGAVLFGSGTLQDLLGSQKGGLVRARKVVGDAWEFWSVHPPSVPERPAVIVRRGTSDFWYGGNGVSHSDQTHVESPMFLEVSKDTKSTIAEPKKRWVDGMAVDAKDDLWAAVWGKGIAQFDGEHWTSHEQKNGLPSDLVINLLASGTWGVIWGATADGMIRFDGTTWSSWELPFDESFTREGVTLRERSGGELWINVAYRSWLLEGRKDPKSRDVFQTHRYQRNSLEPETMILEAPSQLPEGSSVFIKWEGRDQWSETPVSLLEYSWRTNEDDWSPFSRETSVALSGIASGEYTFEVRARDGDMNIDSTAARIDIRIVPPVWKRTWFVSLVVVTLVLIAFLVDKVYRIRIRSMLAMEEFKLDFFTNVSHELRNPLAVILGPLERMLNEETEGKKRSNLALVLRNARKMQGLVDRLLQFRKVELGAANYRPMVGEIVDFIREAVEQLMPLATAKKISVHIYPKEDRCVCGYDSDKLLTIIDNLVSNAVKYSDEGSKITIRVDTSIADGRRELNLVVEDEGIGIPEHELESILKPFYRVNGPSRSQEGFGLGLPLVNSLVQVCGGELSVERRVEHGRGTRIQVVLPLEEVDRFVDDGPDTTSSLETKESGRMRLLIVEDNIDLRSFMRDEFEARFDVLEAGDGRKGFEIAIKKSPDVIITDVIMPVMDGFELCRALRAESETSHIPIVMLTAKSAEEHSVTGMEAGADVYFAKPVNMLRLQAQIDNLLELRRKMKRRFSEKLVVEPSELTVVSADQEFLRKAMSIVEERMSDPDFGVVQFATEMGTGKTTLLKKLKALTGESPGAFIRSMRMKRAAQLLSKGDLSASETLEFIGIREHAYFSKVFKRQFGVSPSLYANKVRGSKGG